MKKILIIDDDAVFGKIYESLFQAEGYLVDLAADFHSALEHLRVCPPDLVLLDLFLGRRSGVEVLRFIRSRGATSGLPVIALSNSSLSRRIDAAWRAGADKFLAKDNIDPERLLKMVRVILTQPGRLDDSGELSSDTMLQPNGAFRSNRIADLVPALSPRMEEYWLLRQELRRHFVREASSRLRNVRDSYEVVVRCDQPEEQRHALMACWETFAAFGRDAELLEIDWIQRLGTITAAVLQDLQEEPHHITPSSTQSIGRAIESLTEMLQIGPDRLANRARPALGLLVEDDPVARWAMGSALDMAGITSVSAEDFSHGLRLAEENRFDLILLDWQLPGANGVELCEQIRANPVNSGAAILIVTGRSDFDSRLRSSMSGANDFVTKPFLVSELALRSLVAIVQQQFGRPVTQSS